MSKEIRSGDHLSDVEISIFIRSSGTDLSDLRKLMNAITASSTSLLDTRVVTIELEEKILTTSGKCIRSLRSKLYVD